MGEAKRRAGELKQWQDSLSDSERIIADAALAAHKNIVMRFGMTGGCYRMTFFLTGYLKEKCGIGVTPIVGFINDGESAIMASHAWFEFEGKKTDIALTLTEISDINPTGSLLILAV